MVVEKSSDTQSLLSKSNDTAYESIESNPPSDEFDGEQVVVKSEEDLSLFAIACILSTAFAYGCIMTTLFLITLPVECERIEYQHGSKMPKSVALGIFVAIAGLTQLVSPLVGMFSDTFR